MENKEELKKELFDKLLKKKSEGKVVINTSEGLMIANVDDLIKQPTEGLLYDLNRNFEVIATFLYNEKWINDFACAVVIEKLKEYYDKSLDK